MREILGPGAFGIDVVDEAVCRVPAREVVESIKERGALIYIYGQDYDVTSARVRLGILHVS
jgi:hypothetical protein